MSSLQTETQPPHQQAPGHFQIKIAGLDLDFQQTGIADPVVTGRQIIEAAGKGPVEEFIVLQWLPDNSLEELRLEETTDLRERGVERFIVAKSDRTFRFEIDGKRLEWPGKQITLEALLTFSGQDPAQFTVWQELKDAPDKQILAGHPADLTDKGVERFYTVMKETTEGTAE